MSSDGSTTGGARFTFYPAVRSGYRPMGDGETAVELAVTADSEDGQETTETVSMPIHVYGPGDVRAIDRRQIARREPVPRTEDHATPQFPLVEFRRPDFPWLFSPESRDEHGRLRPWLCLAVVDRDDPDVGYEPVGPGNLPVLEAPLRELPNPAESWGWAHAQQAGPDEEDGIAGIDVYSRHAFSRVIAPRHLQAKTRYRACLLPTFELGRLSGLGQDPDDAEAGETALWGESLSRDDRIRLPVYDSWTFITGASGDFATLARDLDPTTFGRDVGVRTVDVSKPGPRSLKRPGTGMESTVGLEGALISPAFVQYVRGEEGVEDVYDEESTAQLEALLTGAETLDAAIDERIVSPPLYGRWHANRSSFGMEDWFDDINLDPRYRIAAGLGTIAVQREQEPLMGSAWEQFGDLDLINDYLMRLQLAKEAQESLFERVQDLRVGRTLQLCRPCLDTVLVDDRALAAETLLDDIGTPIGLLETGFRVLTSPTGRLGRRDGVTLSHAGLDRYIEFETVLQRDSQLEPVAPIEADVVSTDDPVDTGGGFDDGSTMDPGGFGGIPIERSGFGSGGFDGIAVDPGAFDRLSVDPMAIEGVGDGSADGFEADSQFLMSTGPADGTSASESGDSTAGPTAPTAGSADPTVGPADPTAALGDWPAGSDGSSADEDPSVDGAADGPGRIDDSDGAAPIDDDAFAESPTERAARERAVNGLDGVERYCRTARSLALSLESAVAAADGETALRRAIDGDLSDLEDLCRRIGPHAIDPVSGALGKLLVEPRPDTVDASLSRGAAEAELDRLRTEATTVTEALAALPDPHAIDVMDGPGVESVLVDVGRSLSRMIEIVAGLRARIAATEAGEASIAGESAETADPSMMLMSQTDDRATSIEAADDLVAVADAVVEDLDPKTRIPEVAASRTGLSIEELRDPSGVIMVEQVMPSPTFDWPMYEELAAIDEEYLLPGIGEIERDAVGLLKTNPSFIQSYMAGLNHEMARLLRWRRYPTDRRGTYFREFWDHAADPTIDPADVEEKADVEELHEWTGDLGEGVIGEASMVLLVRGDLFRRYPNTVVYATKAEWNEDETDREPQVPKGAIDEENLEELPIEFPSFRGELGEDVVFFGFDLTLEDVHGDPGWFFVLEEAPSDHRFGLVGDVYGEELEATAGEYVSLGDTPEWIATRLAKIEEAADDPTEIEELSDIDEVSGETAGPLRYAVWEPGPTGEREWTGERNGAHVANVTYRMPTRIAIHASQMLPDEPADDGIGDPSEMGSTEPYPGGTGGDSVSGSGSLTDLEGSDGEGLDFGGADE